MPNDPHVGLLRQQAAANTAAISRLESRLAAMTAEHAALKVELDEMEQVNSFNFDSAVRFEGRAQIAEARAETAEGRLAEAEEQIRFVLSTLDAFGRRGPHLPYEFWALFDMLDSGLALLRHGGPDAAVDEQPPEPAQEVHSESANELGAASEVDLPAGGSSALSEPAIMAATQRFFRSAEVANYPGQWVALHPDGSFRAAGMSPRDLAKDAEIVVFVPLLPRLRATPSETAPGEQP